MALLSKAEIDEQLKSLNGWTLDGDQLMFTDVRSGDGGPNPLGAALFGSEPWTKLR